MLTLDLNRLITAEDKGAIAQAARTVATKAECGQRIYAVAPQYTQTNIIGARAAGELDSPEDDAAYLAAVKWIADMRAACSTIIANPSLDPGDDSNWPDCPPDVMDLVVRY